GAAGARRRERRDGHWGGGPNRSGSPAAERGGGGAAGGDRAGRLLQHPRGKLLRNGGRDSGGVPAAGGTTSSRCGRERRAVRADQQGVVGAQGCRLARAVRPDDRRGRRNAPISLIVLAAWTADYGQAANQQSR